MSKYYLAIDIGASSGRHILGHLENGRMVLEEIHRFPNGNIEKDGELIWDIDGLFREILVGMRKCKEAGKIPVSVGIDTWAVDIVLLDENDKRLGNTVCNDWYSETDFQYHLSAYGMEGTQARIVCRSKNNAEYLNQLTARETKRTVYAGPTDAAIAKLKEIPVSLHCWQGDDVTGF